MSRSTRKPRPPHTETQRICMEYGQDLWATNNVWSLSRLLRSQGDLEGALALSMLVDRAKDNAKRKYIARRKALDPNWELPVDSEGEEDVY